MACCGKNKNKGGELGDDAQNVKDAEERLLDQKRREAEMKAVKDAQDEEARLKQERDAAAQEDQARLEQEEVERQMQLMMQKKQQEEEEEELELERIRMIEKEEREKQKREWEEEQERLAAEEAAESARLKEDEAKPLLYEEKEFSVVNPTKDGAVQDAREAQEKKKKCCCLVLLLLLALLLAFAFFKYAESGALAKNPAYKGASSVLGGAKDTLVASLTSNGSDLPEGEGIVAVKSPGHKDEGFYRESTPSSSEMQAMNAEAQKQSARSQANLEAKSAALDDKIATLNKELDAQSAVAGGAGAQDANLRGAGAVAQAAKASAAADAAVTKATNDVADTKGKIADLNNQVKEAQQALTAATSDADKAAAAQTLASVQDKLTTEKQILEAQQTVMGTALAKQAVAKERVNAAAGNGHATAEQREAVAAAHAAAVEGVTDAQAKVDSTKSKITALQGQIKDAQTDLSNAKTDEEKARANAKLAELQSDLNIQEKTLEASQNHLATASAHLAVAKERTKALEGKEAGEEAEAAAKAVALATEALTAAKSNVEEIQGNINTLESSINDAQKELAAAKNGEEQIKAAAKLAALQQQLAAEEEELETAHADVATAQADMALAEERVTAGQGNAQGKISQLKAEIKAAEQDKKALTAAKESIKAAADSSADSGRKEYKSDNGCKVYYVGWEAYWALSCDGKERCKSYFNSIAPPTTGWECINGEAPPTFALLKSVISVTKVPGESLVKGEFAKSGNRNGKPMYENEEGCQVSYSDKEKGWEILCYTDWCSEWRVLYCAPGDHATLPTEGWVNDKCKAVGTNPPPAFEVLDLSGNWDEGATEGVSTKPQGPPTKKPAPPTSPTAARNPSPSPSPSQPQTQTDFGSSEHRAFSNAKPQTHPSRPVTHEAHAAREILPEDNGLGIICVGSMGHVDQSCYREVPNTYHGGRYEYHGNNDCKIHFIQGAEYWGITCNGQERCKSFFNSLIPPTRAWQCVNQEKPPTFDLIEAVINVENSPGESLVEGGFSESGTRCGKKMYENSNGCQLSYSSKLDGWEVLCYRDWCHEWRVLYFNPADSPLPPPKGWSQKLQGAAGTAPVPVFNTMDLNANYDNEAVGVSTQQTAKLLRVERSIYN
eukprot:GEMP01002895.1.p1 GENE.GEMP01002895.1~~GEMP01002895.1.p1  ORF type:complete len:1125 (+),score=311.34 GEMP01002895.1:119-3493(+)